MKLRFVFGALFVASIISALPAAGDWPDYRGPHGNGCATTPGDGKKLGLPEKWSETENVRWKTPIEHRGWSTPVVWGNQIWLTTATLDGHDFFAICIDAETGKFLWNEKLFHVDKPEPLGNALNGYASPSPAIEAGRAYVHFGSYGTACVDTRSLKVIWQRTDLLCRHYRGPGSSVYLFENLVILTMDGINLQYLVALDKRTGETVWKTDRTAEWDDLDSKGRPKNDGDLRKSYSTPLIVDADGKPELVSVGAKAIYGYDPRTGKEKWKIAHGCQGCGARPVFGNGLAILPTGYGKTEIIAVRPGGNGVVAGSNVVWRTVRGMPRLSSPVLAGDLLYVMSDVGVVTCLDAKSGDEVYKERIGGEFAASLLYGDDRIYCFSQNGPATVFKAGRKFERIATNKLAAGCMASPAVYGKSLIIRTKSALYRIASQPL